MDAVRSLQHADVIVSTDLQTVGALRGECVAQRELVLIKLHKATVSHMGGKAVRQDPPANPFGRASHMMGDKTRFSYSRKQPSLKNASAFEYEGTRMC